MREKLRSKRTQIQKQEGKFIFFIIQRKKYVSEEGLWISSMGDLSHELPSFKYINN